MAQPSTRFGSCSAGLALLLCLGGCGAGGSGSATPINPASASGGSAGRATGGGDGQGGHAGGASNPEGAGGGPGSGGAGGMSSPAPDAAPVDDGATPETPDAGPPAADVAAPPAGAASVLEDPLPACRQTVPVANSAALAPAIAAAKPGDCLVLADGDYTFPVITKSGTAEAPIIIRAANRLKATVMTGSIELTGANFLALEGLSMTSGGTVLFTASTYCRLTRSRINPTADKGGAWVNMVGKTHHIRVDRNDMGNKTMVGNMIQAGVDTPGHVVQFIQIDRNLFHDVHYGGGNGWETIRAGYSHVAPSMGFITIELNLFRAASGDPETISVKSSDDIVRYNTFRDTAGQICLRHGNRTKVYGNYLLNSGTGDTIRVYGADHKIFNNYSAGKGGILLGAGSADGTDVPGKEHYRVYRAEVVNNTIIGAGVNIGGGLAPSGCTIANNLIQGGSVAGGGVMTKVMGNLTTGGGMVMMNGLWKLTAGSPAIDASLPGFDYVTEDIDGQKRQGKPDLGADELSSDPVLRGPLTEKDVGPDAP